MRAKTSVQTDDCGTPQDDTREAQDVGHHEVEQEQQEERNRVVGARKGMPHFFRGVGDHHCCKPKTRADSRGVRGYGRLD